MIALVSRHSSLVLLALLFLVVVTQFGVVSSNPVQSQSASADEGRMTVAEMSFSEKLKNPCAIVETGSSAFRRTPTSGVLGEEEMQRSLLNELRGKTLLLRDNAQTILRTNVVEDCSTLGLPTVALVPSKEDLEDLELVEVLRLFYTSLLNHTAHVYFISDQSHGDNCAANSIASSAKSLASHMRELMCVLRLCARTFQDVNSSEEDHSFLESTTQILSEQLVDQPMCSRRSVKNCQTVSSTLSLLRAMANYLQRTTPNDAVTTS